MVLCGAFVNPSVRRLGSSHNFRIYRRESQQRTETMNDRTMHKRKQTDLSKREDTFSSKEKKRPSEDEWSKSKKKRMRRLKSKQKKKDFPEKTSTNHDSSAMEMPASKPKEVKIHGVATDTPSNEPKGVKTSSALQQSFMARLAGSRFRELNEVRSMRGGKQQTMQSIAVSFSHNPINTFSILYRNCTRRHLILHSTGSLLIQNYMNNITMDFVVKWSSGPRIQWV
jgi:hypothetical protein